MPPKKAAAAATKKAPSSATHGTYKDMIKDAIVQLKDRMGSSRQAIKKYVAMNNNLGSTTEAALSKHISQALASGEKTGDFVRPKGPSGPVKLGKGTKPATKKTTPTPKTTTTKKPAATKKAASTTTKGATTTKKAASSTKANSAKPRKSAPKKPAAAPAVDDKKPTVIGKTKSGRVQKTTAPQPAKTSATKKKTATKKATKAAA